MAINESGSDSVSCSLLCLVDFLSRCIDQGGRHKSRGMLVSHLHFIKRLESG